MKLYDNDMIKFVNNEWGMKKGEYIYPLGLHDRLLLCDYSSTGTNEAYPNYSITEVWRNVSTDSTEEPILVFSSYREERQKIEDALTEALIAQGFRYLCRDYGGELVAYKKESDNDTEDCWDSSELYPSLSDYDNEFIDLLKLKEE